MIKKATITYNVKNVGPGISLISSNMVVKFRVKEPSSNEWSFLGLITTRTKRFDYDRPFTYGLFWRKITAINRLPLQIMISDTD